MSKKIASILFIFFLVMNLYGFDTYSNSSQGYMEFKNQNYVKAIELFKESLLINSNDIKSNIGLSHSYFMIGEYNESLYYIEKAIIFSKNDIEILNHKARVLMALGNYEESMVLYQRNLKIEPFNINAQSGLAELKIYSGDFQGSLKEFERIVEFSPLNRRLLLSLTVLYDKKNLFDKSNITIQKAILNYPKDPVVLEAAVNHYIKSGNFSGAKIYMDELLKVSKSNHVYLKSGELLILEKKYQDAIIPLKQYLLKEKNNSVPYFYLAFCYEQILDLENALITIERSLSISPDNEIYRFFAERLMSKLYSISDSSRKRFSDWYLKHGELNENNYYFDTARTYYLRGIDINPMDWNLRYNYSRILKKNNYLDSYRKEINFLLKTFPLESKDNNIEKELILIESLPKSEINKVWGDIYLKNTYKFFVDISILEQGQHNNDSLLDETMAYSLNRFLRGERSFRIDDTISFTNNFSSAFAMARTKNSDYFIQLSYKERSNSFTLIADLYLSSSGKKLKTFSYLRTGNNRIFKTLENFASDLNSTFPVIGVIKQIKNNQILTDIGFRDGINTNDDFIIIRNKNIKPDANDFLFKYETSALLGRVKIIQVNESTSSGSIEDDFSNLNAINIGDYIVELPTEEIDKEKIKDHYFLDTELLEQLLLVN